MNKQEERIADRPNQKVWFDGGNDEWKLDGRSRTFRRKVRNIRWRNNKLEGTVIYKGMNVAVRLHAGLDWTALFAYKDEAELERDYGLVRIEESKSKDAGHTIELKVTKAQREFAEWAIDAMYSTGSDDRLDMYGSADFDIEAAIEVRGKEYLGFDRNLCREGNVVDDLLYRLEEQAEGMADTANLGSRPITVAARNLAALIRRELPDLVDLRPGNTEEETKLEEGVLLDELVAEAREITELGDEIEEGIAKLEAELEETPDYSNAKMDGDRPAFEGESLVPELFSEEELDRLQGEAEEFAQYESEIRGNETPPSFEAWQQANEEHKEKVNKLAELGNFVGNGELHEAANAARDLEQAELISSDLRLRIERALTEQQHIHGDIWNIVGELEAEPVVEKKVVLLQKEETVMNGGIRFRVIASGAEGEGFEYEVQGPDGDTVTAGLMGLSLDRALEEGVRVAESLSPDWYAKLRNDEKDENEREEARLTRTANNIQNERIRIQSLIEQITEWINSGDIDPDGYGASVLLDAFENLNTAKEELIIADGKLLLARQEYRS
jgi:hypothetical protein